MAKGTGALPHGLERGVADLFPAGSGPEALLEGDLKAEAQLIPQRCNRSRSAKGTLATA